jgi:enterochelin esterase family protein
MKRQFFHYGLIGLLFIGCSDTPTPESDLKKLQDQILIAGNQNSQQELADRWWEEYKKQGLPRVQDSTALFFYKGKGKNIRLAGDMTNWQPGPLFQRLGQTDLFALEQHYPDSARLDYKFIVDSTWTLDAGNRHQMVSDVGPNSELRMPRYQGLTWLDSLPSIPRGAIEEFMIYSQILGNQRPIRVYVPPDYEQSQVAYPALFINDGIAYLETAKLQVTLDYLIYAGEIRPVVVVCIPPIKDGREHEYGNNPDFADFICDKVVPRIQKRYRVINDPDHRAIMGADLGGLISFYIALNHPEIFRRVAGQSSHFGYRQGEIFNLLPQADLSLYSFYISCGTYETHIGDAGVNFIDMYYRMRDSLRTGRARFGYHEEAAGHSWGFWRDDLPRLLKYLFPAERAAKMPVNPRSMKNFFVARL